jgi:hypothetical protein
MFFYCFNPKSNQELKSKKKKKTIKGDGTPLMPYPIQYIYIYSLSKDRELKWRMKPRT